MSGQIKFIGAVLSIAVFCLAIILFAIGFGEDNSAAFNLGDQPGFNGTANQIKGNLSSFRTEVINSTESFYKSEIEEGETTRTGGQFRLGDTDSLSTTGSVLTQSFTTVFGEDSDFAWVLGTLLTFLGLVLALLIWKTWAGRNPE